MPDRPSEKHPVATGLVALVGVGLVVGLILGLVVLAGTRVLGLGNGEDTATGGSERSMYLPRPQKTTGPSGPEITLQPGDEETSANPDDGAQEQAKKKDAKAKDISLSASTTSAAPMEQVDLTGVYPGGEGAILQVQRFQNGGWEAFPVTVSVSDETFSTYVQTSQSGVNRFRVVDTDTKLKSNEVRFTIR